jgi:hypothetical protein
MKTLRLFPRRLVPLALSAVNFALSFEYWNSFGYGIYGGKSGPDPSLAKIALTRVIIFSIFNTFIVFMATSYALRQNKSVRQRAMVVIGCFLIYFVLSAFFPLFLDLSKMI